METLLVHKSIAKRFLPHIVKKYLESGVEIKLDSKSMNIVKANNKIKSIITDKNKIKKASEKDWSTEYTDMIISIKIVNDVTEAIKHINKYGSGHTDAIVTENKIDALKFLTMIDSSSTVWNASTRFADGYRYGLGAEVGISTNKIHARGPVGLDGLVIYKYILTGDGHIVLDYANGSKKFKHKKIR